MASYDKALAVAPDHSYAFRGLADCAIKLCDWTRSQEILHELSAHVMEQRSIIAPLTLLGYCSDPSLQLACARTYVHDTITTPLQPLWNGTIWRHDRIRIAYLSADFRRHPVAYLTTELFELHDRSRFEVLGISLGHDDGSDIRARIAGALDTYYDVSAIADADVAGLLRDLRVDILVDLTGHTRNARLGILALRPAPIQVNYLV